MTLTPIPTFRGVGAAASHFKRIHERRILEGVSGDLAGVGEECILTEGAPRSTAKNREANKQARTKFWIKGVRVSITGPYGNRRIKVLSFKDEWRPAGKRLSTGSQWD